MREENNLDSDYQTSLMQEGENISIATKTTSQCHVTTVEAASVQETDSCTRRLSSLHLPVVSCWGQANSSLPSLCQSNSHFTFARDELALFSEFKIIFKGRCHREAHQNLI